MTKKITWEDFNSPAAQQTQRLLDYYESRQNKYVQAMLDAQRKRSREKYTVQSRNIVSMIVDKSGLLFNKPPALAIFQGQSTKGISDTVFEQLMDRANWKEKFQNVDTYTRLVKTVVLLQQKYVAMDTTTVGGSYRFNARNGDALLLNMLTQANTVVKTDITGDRITELAYLTGESTNFNEVWEYRYINADVIQDWIVEGVEERCIKTAPNPDGIVPASVFYDVKRPRQGFWAPMPEDIVSFQDNLNLYLCDLQYAIAWQVNPTLFTDTAIIGTSTDTAPVIPYAPPGHTNAGDEQWSQLAPTAQRSIGGLGEIVQVEAGMGGNKPMVEYVGTQTKLKEMHDILSAQVRDVAADWGVTVQAEGGARANSGFQVIVEEMDNLALREQRGQSFEGGLRRFYDITQSLYPELTAGVLKADFAPPTLPVNRLEQVQVYTYMMQNGFGTPVDWWMEQGMTYEDALQKVKDDLALRKQLGLGIPGAPIEGQDGVPAPNPKVNPSNMSQRGGNPRNPENT